VFACFHVKYLIIPALFGQQASCDIVQQPCVSI